MKIKELLEKYYDSYEIVNNKNVQKQVAEIFENPSLKELNKINTEIRFAIIGKKLYVWDTKFMHYKILKKMGKSVEDLGVLTGIAKKEKGKWQFDESHYVLSSLMILNKKYLKSIVNKDYKWVDKYISFTPVWNHYKKEIEKVLK